MAENSRIDDLRRRVQKDPASIAFAQLAEECRRAGQHQEAVDICRSGLEIHPGYLSARVTLGRALIELGQPEEAQVELARVLESASDNLAAIRGLAEIYHRRGELAQALAQYRAALLLARNDPDLEETIADLSHQVEPPKPASSGGLTLEHMQHELLKHAPKADRGVRLQPPNPPEAGAADGTPAEAERHEQAPRPNPADTLTGDDVRSYQPTDTGSLQEAGGYNLADAGFDEEATIEAAVDEGEPAETDFPDENRPSIAVPALTPVGAVSGTLDPGPDERATRTVAALEEWLAAIHVARAR